MALQHVAPQAGPRAVHGAAHGTRGAPPVDRHVVRERARREVPMTVRTANPGGLRRRHPPTSTEIYRPEGKLRQAGSDPVAADLIFAWGGGGAC